MKSKRTKALDISLKVKKQVWERDKGRCVICGNTINVMPNSHYIPRSHGGLGIVENIFTACTNFTPLKCHDRFEKYQCTKEEEERIINNFKSNYSNWNEEMLYYKKY